MRLVVSTLEALNASGGLINLNESEKYKIFIDFGVSACFSVFALCSELSVKSAGMGDKHNSFIV
jgi:hypothetical protein